MASSPKMALGGQGTYKSLGSQGWARTYKPSPAGIGLHIEAGRGCGPDQRQRLTLMAVCAVPAGGGSFRTRR